MRYLFSKNGIVHAECDVCKKELKFKECDLNEIGSGVECFCGNISNRIEGLPLKESGFARQIVVQQPQGPRCPTCGSSDIQKISLTSKAVGGVMWGIFSSNIRNTFKCNKCGYKW